MVNDGVSEKENFEPYQGPRDATNISEQPLTDQSMQRYITLCEKTSSDHTIADNDLLDKSKTELMKKTALAVEQCNTLLGNFY